MNPAINFVLQLVSFQEIFISRGGNDKSFGNGQAYLIFHLPEISHFIPGLVGHVFVHSLQRKRPFSLARYFFLLQLLVDPGPDSVKDGKEGLIPPVRNGIQTLDNFKQIDRKGGTTGSDKGHSKSLIVFQGLLHFIDDFQDFVIKAEQCLKIQIPPGKSQTNFIPCLFGIPDFAFSPSFKKTFQIKHNKDQRLFQS